MITFEELEALGFEKAHAIVCDLLAGNMKHITHPEIQKWVDKHAIEIIRWHTLGRLH